MSTTIVSRTEYRCDAAIDGPSGVTDTEMTLVHCPEKSLAPAGWYYITVNFDTIGVDLSGEAINQIESHHFCTEEHAQLWLLTAFNLERLPS